MSKDFSYRQHTPGLLSYPSHLLYNASPPYKSPLPGDGLMIKYNKENVHLTHNTGENVTTSNKLTKIIYYNILDSAIPRMPKTGHRFLFHDSYEIVPFNSKSFYSNFESVMKILVTPNIRRIDESLESEKPEV